MRNDTSLVKTSHHLKEWKSDAKNNIHYSCLTMSKYSFTWYHCLWYVESGTRLMAMLRKCCSNVKERWATGYWINHFDYASLYEATEDLFHYFVLVNTDGFQFVACSVKFQLDFELSPFVMLHLVLIILYKIE